MWYQEEMSCPNVFLWNIALNVLYIYISNICRIDVMNLLTGHCFVLCFVFLFCVVFFFYYYYYFD